MSRVPKAFGKNRCFIVKKVTFFALLEAAIPDSVYNTVWLFSCNKYVAFLSTFPCSCLHLVFVSLFFTAAGQLTDDDAPPLPWSVESDEQIIVAKTKGFFIPLSLFSRFCFFFVLSLCQLSMSLCLLHGRFA